MEAQTALLDLAEWLLRVTKAAQCACFVSLQHATFRCGFAAKLPAATEGVLRDICGLDLTKLHWQNINDKCQINHYLSSCLAQRVSL